MEGESAAEMTDSEDEGGETEGRRGVPAGSLRHTAATCLVMAWKGITTCAGLVSAAVSAARRQGASGKEKGSFSAEDKASSGRNDEDASAEGMASSGKNDEDASAEDKATSSGARRRRRDH